MTIAYRWGLGSELENLWDYETTQILMWNLIGLVFAAIVAIIARVSIAIFLVRLFGSRKWFKWYIIIFTVLQSVTASATVIVYLLQTNPIQAAWNRTMAASRWDPTYAATLWMTGQCRCFLCIHHTSVST